MSFIKFCAFFLEKFFLFGKCLARLTPIIKNEENLREAKT